MTKGKGRKAQAEVLQSEAKEEVGEGSGSVGVCQAHTRTRLVPA